MSLLCYREWHEKHIFVARNKNLIRIALFHVRAGNFNNQKDHEDEVFPEKIHITNT